MVLQYELFCLALSFSIKFTSVVVLVVDPVPSPGFAFFYAKQYSIIWIVHSLFIHTFWWIFGLFQFWVMLLWTFVITLCVNLCFHFFWVNTYDWTDWILWKMYIELFERLPNSLSKWLYHFAFLPTVYESSSCPTSLTTLGIYAFS